ncbi:C-type lectin domain family 4 member D-like [Scleropages formosus]|uniref:C-type lectin domain family 4 member D-like n=1 Tax=Scleropages formosus TaxID=113540 RepID=A0A0P7Y2E0_SCLFO|nr:C-type lectin domain family 4 member D-like [Scleropages formosus]
MRKQGMKLGVEYVRNQTTTILITVLLASICANIALGVLCDERGVEITVARRRPCLGGARDRQRKLRKAAETGDSFRALSLRYASLCKDYRKLADNCMDPGVEVRECSPCPSSWLQFEDTCYYFSKDKMNFDDSKASCESMGSRLVILHTHKQHVSPFHAAPAPGYGGDVLEEEARKTAGQEYFFWIGLSDKEVEGDWRWVDNSKLNTTFWEISEPDNHLSGGLHGEDCAVLNSRSKIWYDVPCEFEYKRICEMNALKTE